MLDWFRPASSVADGWSDGYPPLPWPLPSPPAPPSRLCYQRVTVVYDRGCRTNEQTTYEHVGVEYGQTRVFEVHHVDGRVTAIPLTRIVCFELSGPEVAR